MIISKIIRSHRYKALLRLKNPSETTLEITHLISSNSVRPSCRVSISFRPFSFLAHFQSQECTEPITSQNVAKEKEKLKKPLAVYFREAVGLLEKTPEDNETEFEGKDEIAELRKKLRKLEEELRLLMENLENAKQKEEKGVKRVEELFKNVSPVENLENTKQKEEKGVKRVDELFKNASPVENLENKKQKKKGFKRVEEPLTEKKSGGLSLSSLFVRREDRDREMREKELKMGNSHVYKPLSPDMEKFVIHLYKNGYFKDSSFLPRNRFDITCFENSYGKDYVRYAAEQFGRDHRQVSKWLSGSDLKKVAHFGCPSLGKKIVFSAKGLRGFFGIQENTVCDKCALKQSCKFVNKSASKRADNNLDLAVVMRVIPVYALELVPPQLVVPQEIKDSVSRLLKEVVNLSETL